MFTMEVLNPIAKSEGETNVTGVAPRLSSLDGLTLGLLWNSKRGGETALMKAGEIISNMYKDVKVIRYNGSMPCEKELMKRAKEECDIFIGSTGD